jgi:hypothetical protein
MGGSCSKQRADENIYKILIRKTKRKDHWEDLGVEGSIILQ